MREIRTSGATRGEVALGVLPYSTVEGLLFTYIASRYPFAGKPVILAMACMYQPSWKR